MVEFKASWDENSKLAALVAAHATKRGFVVVHNASSARWGAWDGWHRYVVLKKGAWNFACTSRDCVTYTEARFSRWGLPSRSGEAAALAELLGRILWLA